jgi:aryl-alcohol dehydrogenase-like predicted oxidoreductase
MKYRKLGSNGPDVSAIGLGCVGMSMLYGTPDEQESIATLHRAIETGVNFFDTSDLYGEGRNESLLGRAFAGRRGEVVIATKFGYMPDGRIDGRPDHVMRACEASLRRLQTDFIDLYYLHRVDPSTPIEETVGAMKRLVQQGKVRLLGLSEASAETIRRAHRTHPLAALQNEYSLWTRDPEKEILALCRDLGIALVPYSPLGRGFLTGTIKNLDGLEAGDVRRRQPRFSEGCLAENVALLDVIEKIAGRMSATPAQVALAWLLGQGDDIIPIPGTKRRKYLEENAGAVELELSGSDLAQLSAAFSPGQVKGERYPEHQMRLLGH